MIDLGEAEVLFFLRNVAAFYLPLEQNDELDQGVPVAPHGDTLEDLAMAAGIIAIPTKAVVPDDQRQVVYYGRWDEVGGAWATLDILDMHEALLIYFNHNDFLDLRLRVPREGNENLTLEQDGALPLAYAFRDACERLRPTAAFLSILPQDATPTIVHEEYGSVLGVDGGALAARRFSLLYLNQRLAEDYEEQKVADDRDSLPVQHGLLLFAGRGYYRW